MTLSRKHSVFIDEYLRCFNATQAYLRVYPKSSYDSARANATRLIAEDSIKEQIDARLGEVHMSANEALKLTADIARGDVASLMEITSVGGNLDLRKAQELGLTRLIKKFKQRTTTRISKTDEGEDTETHDIEIELYNAQDALRDILKIHGKFIDRVDLTTLGTKVTDIGVKQIDYRTGITDIESGSSADSSTPSQD